MHGSTRVGGGATVVAGARVGFDGAARHDERELLGTVRILDTAELDVDEDAPGPLADALDRHLHVAHAYRLADRHGPRRIVLAGDAQQLHDAGDEDRQPAHDGEQQQGAGTHGAAG